MEWWNDWGKDVVVALIAIYGAALSTINWWQARRKDQRTLRLDWDDHIHRNVPDGRFFGSTKSVPVLIVKATNTGYRSVPVAALGIELEDGTPLRTDYDGSRTTRLPAQIGDGAVASAWIDEEEVLRALQRELKRDDRASLPATIRVFPYAKSAIGGTYRGPPKQLVISELDRR